MKFLPVIAVFTIAIISIQSCRKSDYLLPEEKQIIADNGEGTGTVSWTKDMDIVLQGFVFVNEGQTLTIEAGSTIRFAAGEAASASALIVARGGKLIAQGTKEEPIIFTAEADNLDYSLGKDTSGLWGGIILLGNAPINTSTGESFVEGIPTSEPRGLFGGTEAADNSGILEYVSIRYPGTSLYEGNEINGLTLAGVGSATSINNVEIINSADDGIEMFGGTVNLTNIAIINPLDDAIDYDYGYTGNGQYILAIQQNNNGGSLIEGGSEGFGGITSTPVFANLTLIGDENKVQDEPIKLIAGAGGMVFNSLICNSPKAISIEYINNSTDCYYQWKQNNLKIENNIVYNINGTDSVFSLMGNSFSQEHLDNWQNYFTNGKNIINNCGIKLNKESSDLKPTIPTNTLLFDLSIYGLDNTANYKGAIGINDWTDQWTSIRKYIR
jgi:hypothetical protein